MSQLMWVLPFILIQTATQSASIQDLGRVLGGRTVRQISAELLTPGRFHHGLLISEDGRYAFWEDDGLFFRADLPKAPTRPAKDYLGLFLEVRYSKKPFQPGAILSGFREFEALRAKRPDAERLDAKGAQAVAAMDGRTLLLVHRTYDFGTPLPPVRYGVSKVILDSPFVTERVEDEPHKNTTLFWAPKGAEIFAAALDRVSPGIAVLLKTGETMKDGSFKQHLEVWLQTGAGSKKVASLTDIFPRSAPSILFDSSQKVVLLNSLGPYLWLCKYGAGPPKQVRVPGLPSADTYVARLAWLNRDRVLVCVIQNLAASGSGFEPKPFLYIFDLKSKAFRFLGPYALYGASASGQVLLVREASPDSPVYLIFRK